MITYGKKLILDLHNCDPKTFNRKSIFNYFVELCNRIDMQRETLHFWDDEYTEEKHKETEPHLKGISAIQFIKTSNITLHTLEILKKAYVNIFSCKDFEAAVVESFTSDWFGGTVVQSKEALMCPYCIVERDTEHGKIYYMTFVGCPLDGNETTVYRHGNIDKLELKLAEYQDSASKEES